MFPSGGSRENYFLAFSSFLKLPIFLGLWPPLSIFKASNAASLWRFPKSKPIFPLSTSLWLSPFLSLSPTFKDPVVTLGPPDNPGNSPHLKVLHFITSTKSLLPCKVTYSQVPEVRMYMSLEGGHYSAYHPSYYHHVSSGMEEDKVVLWIITIIVITFTMIESRLRDVVHICRNGHDNFLSYTHFCVIPSHADYGLDHVTYFGQWEITNRMQSGAWRMLARWDLPSLAILYTPLTTMKTPKWVYQVVRHMWPRHLCHWANSQYRQVAPINQQHKPPTFKSDHLRSSSHQLTCQKPQVHEEGQQCGAKLHQTRRTAQISNRILS